MTYGKKTAVFTATILAMTIGASAQGQQPESEKDKLVDPLTRAEMQCLKYKKDAENGTDDQKKAAEQKCIDAIAWAKEMMKKKQSQKPVPDPQ